MLDDAGEVVRGRAASTSGPSGPELLPIPGVAVADLLSTVAGLGLCTIELAGGRRLTSSELPWLLCWVIIIFLKRGGKSFLALLA